MRITLGNIDGKAYGLNASEACVYAAIEKCSKGENAKGWYGTMRTLAEVLPFAVSHKTCGRAIAKLLTLGLIREDGEKLYAQGQNVPNDGQNVPASGQNVPENGQNVPENGQNVLPPIPPLYSNKKMEEKKKEQPRADMRTRDGANQQPGSGNLIESFNALKRAWIVTGGASAEFERRAVSLWKAWTEMSEVKRRAIARELSIAAMNKRQPEHWKDNPLFFVQDYPEPEPTDYNGSRLEPPEPTEIACYNGHWGMYTRTDIRLYNLQTKERHG